MTWPSIAHQRIAEGIAKQRIQPTTPAPVLAFDFWSQVRRLEDEASCWHWLGTRQAKGYGFVRLPGTGQTIGAHRLALWLDAGVIAAGHYTVARHLCHAPSCCRPSHLLLGSQADNVWDRQMLARGHDLVAIRRQVERDFAAELRFLETMAHRAAWSARIARDTRIVNRRAA